MLHGLAPADPSPNPSPQPLDSQVGEPVLVVVEDADLVPAFASYTLADAVPAEKKKAPEPKAEEKADKPSSPPPAPKKAAAPKPAAKKPQGKPAAPGARVIASPYARKLAAEAGVDLATLSGSGLGGRVIAADVTAAEGSGAAAAPLAPVETDGEWDDVAVSQIKAVTAKRLLESKTTVPHYYLSAECRVDALQALRATLNASLAGSGAKLSLNDFVIKAAALALRRVPEVNASWHGDFVRQYSNVDVSVAVQTEAGLMVPIVRDADLKGLRSIAAEVKELAGKVLVGRG